MSNKNVVLGTLAGLAIGAIAGILLAPEKGSTTRKKIKAKGGDYADELKSKFDQFIDMITTQFEHTSKEAEDLVNKGNSKYEEVKQNVKTATNNLHQDIGSNIKK